MSEQIFRWYITVEYRPKMYRNDEVSWEITRDDETKTLIDFGRQSSLDNALEDIGVSLDDDVREFRS